MTLLETVDTYLLERNIPTETGAHEVFTKHKHTVCYDCQCSFRTICHETKWKTKTFTIAFKNRQT